jgi:hypothetical protein
MLSLPQNDSLFINVLLVIEQPVMNKENVYTHWDLDNRKAWSDIVDEIWRE